MSAFLTPLTELISPPWNYVLGIGFLIMLLAPRLTELYREFLDAQMGRRHLEFEKLRLEILKLSGELKTLGVVQERVVLKEVEQKIPVTAHPASKPEPSAPKHHGRFRQWCARHPRFAQPILFITQIISAFLMVVFILDMVIIPIAFWRTEELFHPIVSIMIALIYGALAWLSYKGLVVSRSIRKEITAGAANAPGRIKTRVSLHGAN